jgi:hypothetical protein
VVIFNHARSVSTPQGKAAAGCRHAMLQGENGMSLLEDL